MAFNLRNRSFVKELDFKPEELRFLLKLSADLKAAKYGGYEQPRLGAGIPYSVPRGTYRCRDGVWVALSTSAESVAERVLALARSLTASRAT